MSKVVYIDEEECIGCGSCVEICPEVFQMKEDEEKTEVIKPEGGSRRPDPGSHGHLPGFLYPLGRVSKSVQKSSASMNHWAF
jgi:ferredoxin